jgi:hypothetical protein
MKTLMKGSDDITMTIDIQPGPPVTSPDGSPTMPPGMTGPFTLKGTQTLDLEPA